MEKYIDTDMWQLQLAMNVHKVRCADCIKSLLRNTVLMLIEHTLYIKVVDCKEVNYYEFIPSFVFFKNLLMNAVKSIKNIAHFCRQQ